MRFRMLNPIIVAVSLLLSILAPCQADTSTELTPGTVVNDLITGSERHYFKCSLASQEKDLTITVTPLDDGDPDIFASLTTEFPDETSEFKGRHWGEDSVSIPHSAFAAHEWVYITVAAFRRSNFTIVCSFESTIELSDGVPQGGFVHLEGIDYYKYVVPQTPSQVSLNIYALPLAGSLKVYVSSKSETIIPDNSETYDISSEHKFDGEGVTIDSNSPFWPTTTGVFYIAIKGSTECYYSLTASLNVTSSRLAANVPISLQLLADQYAYYQFQLSNNDCSLTFTVTSISGDPDLFISRTNPKPDVNDNDRASRRYGTDYIMFSRPASMGTYYVSVYAWRASSFTLVVNPYCGNNATGTTWLQEGVSVGAVVEAGNYKYYRYTANSPRTSLDISVTSNYGDPDIYVVTGTDLPSIDNWTWRSRYLGSDVLVIDQDDSNACPRDGATSCVYTIAVFAEQAASYSIQVAAERGLTVLRDGVPHVDYVRANQYEYFQIPMNSNSALSVTVAAMGRGDPDLFISTSQKGIMYPNSTRHTWHSRLLAADAITIPPTDPDYCSPCTYYISVFGYSNTTFTVTARYQDPSGLIDGVSTHSSVQMNELILYYFDVRPGYGHVSFSLFPEQGFADIYVKAGSTYPTSDDYDYWSQWWSGTQVINIDENDSHAKRCTVDANSGYCRYTIAVRGGNNATFSLLASTADSIIQLRNGIAVDSSVSPSKFKYFAFRVDESNYDLSIILTGVSGDPDLYIKRGGFPNTTVYDRASTRYGGDTIDIDNVVAGTYFIGVRGYTNATFSVLAVLLNPAEEDHSNVVTLRAGVPQNDLVRTNHWRYYRFDVLSVVGVQFSLTRQFGDPDLYITDDMTFPNATNFKYSSNTAETDVITIDDGRVATYMVGVRGYNTAQFSLTVSLLEGFTQLLNGISQQGQLQAHQSAYYIINTDNDNADIVVSLNALAGDSDIFISCIEQYPNLTHSQWRSIRYMSDAITIRSDDEKKQSCIESGKYYVAVYSTTVSRYSISASWSQPASLFECCPISGSTYEYGWVFYNYHPSDTSISSITFKLQSIDGDPIVYVDRAQEPNFLSTHKSNSWERTVSYSKDSDSDFCTSGDDCVYHIGVYASTASHFTLQVITDRTDASNTILTAGVPLQSSLIQGEWAYYSFRVYEPGLDISFVVSPLTGDPDLYISTKYQHPNQTNYDQASSFGGGDSILFERSAAPLTYYIGVRAFRNTTYTITALADRDTGGEIIKSRLINGQPQNDILKARHWRYFIFSISQPRAELTVTVNRKMGDPDLYISHDGLYPNLTHSQWNSHWSGDDRITILNPEQGDYIIGVYAFVASNYSIVATTSAARMFLADGVSFSEYLSGNSAEYFVFRVDDLTKDVTISVTTFSGDPDLYISDITEFPSSTNYTYRSSSWRDDSVTIRSADLHYGYYYVAVVAYTNCSFTIQASFKGSAYLQNGVQQSGSLVVNSIDYYKYFLLADSTSLTISVTPTSGYVYLLVSTTEEPSLTNSSSYQWSKFSFGGIQRLMLNRNDPAFCVDCTYYIGVYGYTASSYVISANSGGGSGTDRVQLQESIPYTSTVDVGHCDYYSYRVVNDIYAVQFSVTPQTGDPDIYISTTNPTPSADDSEYHGTKYGGDEVYIDYTQAQPGIFYICVTPGDDSLTTYTLTAHTIDLRGSNDTGSTLLINGVPQIGILEHFNEIHYYEFPVRDNDADVIITATPYFGDPDVFVRDDDGPLNSHNYTWRSMDWGKDSLVIKDGCNKKQSSCTFRIAVVAYTHTMFSLVATTANHVTQLLSSVPINDHVEPTQYRYYSIYVDKAVPELIVSVTAYSGDPDLFISKDVNFPNVTNYDLSSRDYGDDVIVIKNPEVFATYHISVYGFINCSYSLTATVGTIMLLPGRPYQDTLHGSDSRLFAFNYYDNTRQPLIIALTKLNNADLTFYVTNSKNGSMPSAAVYQWSSTGALQIPNTLILVPGFEENYCTNCTYFVRVVSSDSNYRARYTLRFSSYSDPQLVPIGQPMVDSIDQTYRYYKASIDNNINDVYIDVTMFTGDVSLCIGQSKFRLQAGLCTWKVDSTSKSFSFSISNTDKDLIVGEYLFLRMSSTQGARFQLTITTTSTALTLGVPTAGSIRSDGYNYFSFSVEGEHDISITITDDHINHESNDRNMAAITTASTSSSMRRLASLSEGVRLYSLYISNNNSITEPGPSSYTWKQEGLPPGTMVNIDKSNPLACHGSDAHCTYYMALRSDVGAPFSLTVATPDSHVLLLNDQTIKTVVGQGSTRYFDVPVQSQIHNISIYAEPCEGDVDVFISQTVSEPSRTRSTWSSNSDVALDTVSIYDEFAAGSQFYIAIIPKVDPRVSVFTFTIRTRTNKAEPAAPTIQNRQSVFPVVQSASSILVRFAPATSAENHALRYTVFYGEANAPGVIWYSKCGLTRSGIIGMSFTEDQLTKAADGYYEVTVEGLSDTVNYMVTVMVEDISTGEYQTFSPQSASTSGAGTENTKNSDTLKYVFGIGVPVLFVLVAGVGYLVWRNKQLSKELEIEMHDVPKAVVRKAVQRGGNEGKANKNAQKYSTLLTEEDEDSTTVSDEIYEPPTTASQL